MFWYMTAITDILQRVNSEFYEGQKYSFKSFLHMVLHTKICNYMCKLFNLWCVGFRTATCNLCFGNRYSPGLSCSKGE